MTSVSGAAAIAWMERKRTNVPGTCLNTVWQAYGSHNSIGAHAGHYPVALNGWLYATKKHPGDEHPPAGVPVWFGASTTRHDSNAAAGDVVISLGGGQVIATDVGGAGKIGVTTIEARAAAISRPYLGWTEDFLGYDVAYTHPAAAPASTGKAKPVASESALIHAVQAKLKAEYPLYAGHLVVDGIEGPQTKAAIEEFQRRSHLVVDGIVGPKTRAALGV